MAFQKRRRALFDADSPIELSAVMSLWPIRTLPPCVFATGPAVTSCHRDRSNRPFAYFPLGLASKFHSCIWRVIHRSHSCAAP